MARKYTGATVRLDMHKLEELEQRTPGRVDELIGQLAYICQDIMITSFNTSPPGRTYGKHIASQPGYPPNVDIGNLKNSIHTRKIKRWVWAVQVGAEYAPDLEYGTVKMAARPFVLPAVEQVAARVRREGLLKKVIED